MPWTKKQNKLFRAVEHGWNPPKSSGIDISKEDATRMAHEGVKGEKNMFPMKKPGVMGGPAGKMNKMMPPEAKGKFTKKTKKKLGPSKANTNIAAALMGKKPF